MPDRPTYSDIALRSAGHSALAQIRTPLFFHAHDSAPLHIFACKKYILVQNRQSADTKNVSLLIENV